MRLGEPLYWDRGPLDRLRAMTTNENKRLIRRYYDEIWNVWDFDVVDALVAREIVFRGSLGTVCKGREAFCDYMRRVQAAFPDFHNVIEELVAEDDRVVARLAYSGTHQGEIFGVHPTGRVVRYSGAAFFRIAESKIAEGWVLGDVVSLLRQLGAASLPYGEDLGRGWE